MPEGHEIRRAPTPGRAPRDRFSRRRTRPASVTRRAGGVGVLLTSFASSTRASSGRVVTDGHDDAGADPASPPTGRRPRGAPVSAPPSCAWRRLLFWTWTTNPCPHDVLHSTDPSPFGVTRVSDSVWSIRRRASMCRYASLLRRRHCVFALPRPRRRISCAADC